MTTRGQRAFLRGLYADPYIRLVRQAALNSLARYQSEPKSNNRQMRILDQQRHISEFELDMQRWKP